MASEETLKHALEEIKDELGRVASIVDGDAKRDIKGLRERVKQLETVVNEIQQERRDTRNMVRGLSIGVGLNLLAGFGTWFTVLSQALGWIK